MRRGTGPPWRTAVVLAVDLGLVTAGCGDGDGEQASKQKAEPTAGTWKTWVLSTPTEVPVPPPPEKGSAQEKAEDQEFKGLAAKRTPEVKDRSEATTSRITRS